MARRRPRVIGNGVVYQWVNAGDGMVIADGGYTVHPIHSTATELVDVWLGAAGDAVRGPAQAHAAREIGNSKLSAVAHSSGSFVAHEMLQ